MSDTLTDYLAFLLLLLLALPFAPMVGKWADEFIAWWAEKDY